MISKEPIIYYLFRRESRATRARRPLSATDYTLNDKQVEGRESLKFIARSIFHLVSDKRASRYLSIYQISVVYAGCEERARAVVSSGEDDTNPRGIYSADKNLKRKMESRLIIHGDRFRGSSGGYIYRKGRLFREKEREREIVEEGPVVLCISCSNIRRCSFGACVVIAVERKMTRPGIKSRYPRVKRYVQWDKMTILSSSGEAHFSIYTGFDLPVWTRVG